MPKFKKIHPISEDGWSDYETPVMSGYKMACCDCNLVHDVDFVVLRVTEHLPNGDWRAEELDQNEYRVALRARRNNRSTGQLRRRK